MKPTATDSLIFDYASPQIVAWLYLIISVLGPGAISDLLEDSLNCEN